MTRPVHPVIRVAIAVAVIVVAGLVARKFKDDPSIAAPTIAPTVALVSATPAPTLTLLPIDVKAVDRLVTELTTDKERKAKEWAKHEREDSEDQYKVVAFLAGNAADQDAARPILERFHNRHRRLLWELVVTSLYARDSPKTLKFIWTTRCEDSEGQNPRADPVVVSKARDVLRVNFGLELSTCATYLK